MSRKEYVLFDKDTKAFVYGYQTNAIQRMLDLGSYQTVACLFAVRREGIHDFERADKLAVGQVFGHQQSRPADLCRRYKVRKSP